MLNILPTEEKKKVISEYHLRLGIVLVCAITALVIASLILLIPSYILATSKYHLVADNFAKLESMQNNIDEQKGIDAKITEVNKKISMLLNTDSYTSATVSSVILKIIAEKGSAVKIKSILYDKNSDRERYVVSGTADTRDGMASFVESLKKDLFFTRVDIPIGSYVKSANIDFGVVLEHGTPPKTL
ncbi:MAG: hypothetical protein PHS95_01110 [Candidatus Pacebacteria bacterium]|nr:hypothetical protein [Candidatus Paceibacterota bacterium]